MKRLLDYILLFAKGAGASRLDTKSSLKLVFFYYFFKSTLKDTWMGKIGCALMDNS